MTMRKLSKSIERMAFALAVGLLSMAAITNALSCYACSYLEGYQDTSCLTNASSLRPINCTKKYCLTVRQESVRNASKVISFLRDCQDKPLILNGVKADASHRFYYRSCQRDLCNGHDGRTTNSSGGGGGGGGNHNGIVPGKNSGARSSSAATSLRAAAAILLLLLSSQ